MKKIMLIISISLLGCVKENEPEGSKLPIINIDGCEYFRMFYDNHAFYTHKGNCSNPVHYFKDNDQFKYKIDLPNDYVMISTDSLHKDTLHVFASGDTLHFSK